LILLQASRYVGYLLQGWLFIYNRNIVRMRRQFAAVIVVLAASCLLQAKQLVIVGERTSAPANIKSTDLAGIFGPHRTWPEGKPITIVMRDPSSPDAELFLRRVLNLTSDQMHAFVQAHPGIIVVADSDEAVLRIVCGNRNAIGVIDLYSLTKDVNVVKLDGKLPLEPGYLLKGN